jgi:hypothetical protein
LLKTASICFVEAHLNVQGAWRTQQGVEHMLADIEDFFKQSLQSFVQDSSLIPRDLEPPARFKKARDLVSSTIGSNSFQPI